MPAERTAQRAAVVSFVFTIRVDAWGMRGIRGSSRMQSRLRCCAHRVQAWRASARRPRLSRTARARRVLGPGNGNLTGAVPAGTPFAVLQVLGSNMYAPCNRLPCSGAAALHVCPPLCPCYPTAARPGSFCHAVTDGVC